MMLWVKLPSDVFGVEPALRHTAHELRATYLLLFGAARHREPLRGALVDDRLRPLSQRYLARRVVHVPRATLQDHISRLRQAALISQDLTGIISIPLVSEVHRRFSSNDDDGRDPVDSRGREAVDNLRIEGLIGAQVAGPPAKVAGPPAPHTPRSSEENYVRAVDDAELVENPAPQGARLLADLVASVPEEVSDSTCRYLLGRLAERSGAWAQLVTDSRDRATLRRLYVSSPGALLTALQQAADEPDQIRNPGAWLTRTVPAIAGGMAAGASEQVG